jgi:2-aminobenzoate-CoA ligase
MTQTAHVDTFAADHLPPRDTWPELHFDLPELAFPERLNCAVELLDKAVHERGWGDRKAVRSARGDLTYRELLDLTNRIANVLVEDMGLVPGNRVLLHGRTNPMTFASWLAILKAGGIVVATMPLLRARELATAVEIAQISHALCDSGVAAELRAALPACPTLRRVEHFNGDADEEGLERKLAAKPVTFQNVDTALDDTCMIAFTSGTTGRPKGTMHFHRDVMAACACFPRSTMQMEPPADDIFCGTPPLAFTYGLGGLLLFPLSVGASALLIERLTPELLLRAIEEHRVTVTFSAPTFYRMMAQQPGEFDLSSLRKCVSAGEALSASTRELWKARTGNVILDGLGSTEMLHMFISATEEETLPGATGKPIPGYRAKVVDVGGNPVPPGTVGRLAVQGPTGCRYLNDPRQASYVQDGWNFTGDAYWVDEAGYYHYHARTDDMIISAGYNIAGAEVEEALLGHAAIAECAVVGLPDAERGQIVAAFVVLKPGLEGTPELTRELQERVKSTIAPYKYPRAVHYRGALPRTPSGKLQRFKVREEHLAPQEPISQDLRRPNP